MHDPRGGTPIRFRSATRARTTLLMTTLVWALAIAAVVLLALQMPQDTAPHRSSLEQTTVLLR